MPESLNPRYRNNTPYSSIALTQIATGQAHDLESPAYQKSVQARKAYEAQIADIVDSKQSVAKVMMDASKAMGNTVDSSHLPFYQKQVDDTLLKVDGMDSKTAKETLSGMLSTVNARFKKASDELAELDNENWFTHPKNAFNAYRSFSDVQTASDLAIKRSALESEIEKSKKALSFLNSKIANKEVEARVELDLAPKSVIGNPQHDGMVAGSQYWKSLVNIESYDQNPELLERAARSPGPFYNSVEFENIKKVGQFTSLERRTLQQEALQDLAITMDIVKNKQTTLKQQIDKALTPQEKAQAEEQLLHWQGVETGLAQAKNKNALKAYFPEITEFYRKQDNTTAVLNGWKGTNSAEIFGEKSWYQTRETGKSFLKELSSIPNSLNAAIASIFLDRTWGREFQDINTFSFEPRRGFLDFNKDRVIDSMDFDKKGNPIMVGSGSAMNYVNPKTGKTDWNFTGLPALIGDVTGLMLPLIFSRVPMNKLGKPLSGMLGKAGINTAEGSLYATHIVPRVQTMLTVSLQTFPQMYSENLLNFKDKNVARNVSLMQSMIEGFTESLGPDVVIDSKLYQKAIGNLPEKLANVFGRKLYATEAFIRAIAPRLDDIQIGKLTNFFVKTGATGLRSGSKLVGTGTVEGLEEVMSLFMNQWSDSYASSKEITYKAQDFTMDAALESFAGGFLGTILSPVTLVGNFRKQKDLDNYSRWAVANNPEVYLKDTIRRIDKSDLTPEQKTKAKLQATAEVDYQSKLLAHTVGDEQGGVPKFFNLATLLPDKDAAYKYFSSVNDLKELAKIDTETLNSEQKAHYDELIEAANKTQKKLKDQEDKYHSLSDDDKKKIVDKHYDAAYSDLKDLPTDQLGNQIGQSLKPIKVSSHPLSVYSEEKRQQFNGTAQDYFNRRVAAFDLAQKNRDINPVVGVFTDPDYKVETSADLAPILVQAFVNPDSSPQLRQIAVEIGKVIDAAQKAEELKGPEKQAQTEEFQAALEKLKPHAAMIKGLFGSIDTLEDQGDILIRAFGVAQEIKDSIPIEDQYSLTENFRTEFEKVKNELAAWEKYNQENEPISLEDFRAQQPEAVETRVSPIQNQLDDFDNLPLNSNADEYAEQQTQAEQQLIQAFNTILSNNTIAEGALEDVKLVLDRLYPEISESALESFKTSVANQKWEASLFSVAKSLPDSYLTDFKTKFSLGSNQTTDPAVPGTKSLTPEQEKEKATEIDKVNKEEKKKLDRIDKELEELQIALKEANAVFENEQESTLKEQLAHEIIIEENITIEEIEDLKAELDVETKEEVIEKVTEALAEEIENNGPAISEVKPKTFLQKIVAKLKKIFLGLILAGTIYTVGHFASPYSVDQVNSFAMRGLVKYGLVTPKEEKLEIKKDTTVILKTSDSVYRSSVTKFEKISKNSEGIWSYRNQFLNDKGFTYIAGVNNAHFREHGKIVYKGVEGVAHHLIMLDEAGDLTSLTSDNALKAASIRIQQSAKPEDYIPIVTRNNNTVHITYAKAKDLKGGEITPIRLRQTKVSDLDFTKQSAAEGFKSNIHAVTQISTGKGFNSLVYVDKSAYGKFSGGAVVLLFKDSSENLIVREYSGSINGIEQEIQTIINQFGVQKDQITLGVYDAGSYTGKVGSKNNEIDPKRYQGYNPMDKGGSSLMIPVQESAEGLSLGLTLLALLRKRRKDGESITSEDILKIQDRIDFLIAEKEKIKLQAEGQRRAIEAKYLEIITVVPPEEKILTESQKADIEKRRQEELKAAKINTNINDLDRDNLKRNINAKYDAELAALQIIPETLGNLTESQLEIKKLFSINPNAVYTVMYKKGENPGRYVLTGFTIGEDTFTAVKENGDVRTFRFDRVVSVKPFVEKVITENPTLSEPIVEQKSIEELDKEHADRKFYAQSPSGMFTASDEVNAEQVKTEVPYTLAVNQILKNFPADTNDAEISSMGAYLQKLIGPAYEDLKSVFADTALSFEERFEKSKALLTFHGKVIFREDTLAYWAKNPTKFLSNQSDPIFYIVSGVEKHTVSKVVGEVKVIPFTEIENAGNGKNVGDNVKLKDGTMGTVVSIEKGGLKIESEITMADIDKLSPSEKVKLYKENGITKDDGSPITEKDIQDNPLQYSYDFMASSNSGKWNSANSELESAVKGNRKQYSLYKFTVGDFDTFKEMVDFINSKNYGDKIEYTDRMKRADETMTPEERQSAIDSYNNSVEQKSGDKAQKEKDILDEHNFTDEKDYSPQELIDKFPLKGVQKIIWDIIKPIVDKLGIKVKFSSSRITEGFDGSNNPLNGEILLRPSTIKNGRLGEVLVHEVVHALTTKIISRVNSGVETGLSAKQVSAVKGLTKLYESVKSDNKLENKYPVKDVFEFIAHLTNENFVKELESKDRNFIQKVVDYIADILGITNANELAKKHLKDIISDGTFLEKEGVTVVSTDYAANVKGAESLSPKERLLEALKNKIKPTEPIQSKVEGQVNSVGGDKSALENAVIDQQKDNNELTKKGQVVVDRNKNRMEANQTIIDLAPKAKSVDNLYDLIRGHFENKLEQLRKKYGKEESEQRNKDFEQVNDTERRAMELADGILAEKQNSESLLKEQNTPVSKVVGERKIAKFAETGERDEQGYPVYRNLPQSMEKDGHYVYVNSKANHKDPDVQLGIKRIHNVREEIASNPEKSYSASIIKFSAGAWLDASSIIPLNPGTVIYMVGRNIKKEATPYNSGQPLVLINGTTYPLSFPTLSKENIAVIDFILKGVNLPVELEKLADRLDYLHYLIHTNANSTEGRPSIQIKEDKLVLDLQGKELKDIYLNFYFNAYEENRPFENYSLVKGQLVPNPITYQEFISNNVGIYKPSSQQINSKIYFEINESESNLVSTESQETTTPTTAIPAPDPVTTNEKKSLKPVVEEDKPKKKKPDPRDLFRDKSLPKNTDKKKAAAAKLWYEGSKLFGVAPYHVLDHIVHSQAYAAFVKGSVLLFNGSNFTDLYHEGWHVFSQYFLTKPEKIELYKKIRNKKGTFTYKGKQVAFSSLTDFGAEEWLAEEFRNYALNRVAEPETKNLFERIWDFLKNFFEYSPETIFEKLYTGKFEHSYSENNIMFQKLNREKETSLTLIASNDAEVIFADRDLDELISNLDALTIELLPDLSEGLEQRITLGTIYSNRELMAPMYSLIRSSLIATYNRRFNSRDENDLAEQSLLERYSAVLENWDQVIETLKQNSTIFQNKRFSAANDEILTSDDSTNDFAYNRSIEEFSTLSRAPLEIVGLVSAIPAYEQGEEKIGKLMGLPVLANFTKNWKMLSETLEGIRDYDHIYFKIQELIKSYPEFQYLIAQLPRPDQEVRLGELNLKHAFVNIFSEPMVEMYKLRIDKNADESIFVSVQKAQSRASTYIKADWKLRFQSGHSSELLSGGALDITEFNKEKEIISRIVNIKDQVTAITALLQKLGFYLDSDIVNNIEESERVEFVDKAFDIFEKLTQLDEAKIRITIPIEQVGERHEIAKDKFSNARAKSVNYFVDLHAAHQNEYATDEARNPNGDYVYKKNQFHFMTIVASLFNKPQFKDGKEFWPSKGDIIAKAPWARFLLESDNPWIYGSSAISAMFNTDGTRKLVKGKPLTNFNISHFGGVEYEENDNLEGVKSFGSEPIDKLLTDINAFITAGIQENIRFGDKSNSYATHYDLPLHKIYKQADIRKSSNVEAHSFLPFKDDTWKQHLQAYTDHFIAEVLTINQWHETAESREQYKNLKVPQKGATLKFYSFLPSELKERLEDSDFHKSLMNLPIQEKVKIISQFIPEIESKIIEWIENSADELRQYIKDKAGISSVEGLIPQFGSFRSLGLSTNHLLLGYAFYDTIHRIEQTKMFFGNLGYYESIINLFKRLSQFSATGNYLVTDKQTLDSLNSNPAYGKKIQEIFRTKKNKKGKSDPYTSTINSVILEDEIVDAENKEEIVQSIQEAFNVSKTEAQEIAKGYGTVKVKGAKATDGQGVATLDFYRFTKITTGQWLPEHEDTYKKEQEILKAYLRYKKIIKDPELQSEARDLAREIDQIKTSIDFGFAAQKPQVSGMLDSKVPVNVFHKFSIIPVTPSSSILVLEDSKRLPYATETDMYKWMENMYRDNGDYGIYGSGVKSSARQFGDKYNQMYKNGEVNTDPLGINSFSADFFKEQLPITSAKDSITDVIFPTQMRGLLFLDEAEQGEFKDPIQEKLHSEYKQLIHELIAVERQTLKQQLGATKDDFSDIDPEAFQRFLVKELNNKDISNDAYKFITIKDGKFEFDLNGSTERRSLAAIAEGVVYRRIVKQKLSGTNYVLASSVGHGVEGKNNTWFYSKQDQSMGVKIPFSKRYKPLLNIIYKGEPIGTLARLNSVIQEPEFVKLHGAKITMVGCRVPVQGLNSQERMRVAEFLSPSLHQIMLLPPEAVVKSGLDYDIDKFFVFEPNLRSDGELHGYVSPAEETAIREQIATLNKEYTELKTTITSEIKILKGLLPKGASADKLLETVDSIQKQIGAYESDLDSVNIDYAAKSKGKKITLDELKEIRNEAHSAIHLQAEKEIEKLSERLSKITDQIEIKKELDELTAPLKIISTKVKELIKDIKDIKNGRSNRFVSIVSERLANPNIFGQLVTPNENMDLQRKIEGKELPNYFNDKRIDKLDSEFNGTNFFTAIKSNQVYEANVVAKATLGIAARINRLHPLLNLMNISTNGTLVNLKTPGDNSLAMLNDVSGRPISRINSQILNGLVDIANGDWISKLGVDKIRGPVQMYMLQQGINYEDVFALTLQPAVIDYISERSRGELIFAKLLRPTPTKKEIRIAALIKWSGYGLGVTDIKDILTHAPKIFDNATMIAEMQKRDDFKNQIYYLAQYIAFESYSQNLTDLDQLHTPDTKKEISIIEAETNNLDRNKLVASNFFNGLENFDRSVIAEFKELSQFSADLQKSVNKLLTDEVVEALSKLTIKIRNKANNFDMGKVVSRMSDSLVQYILHNNYQNEQGENLFDKWNLASITDSPFAINNTENLSVRLQEIYDKSLSLDYNIKAEYPVLSFLSGRSTKNADFFSFSFNAGVKLTAQQKNEFKSDFKALLNFSHSDTEFTTQVRNTVGDILEMSYLATAFQYFEGNISQIIPEDVYIKNATFALNHKLSSLELRDFSNKFLLYNYPSVLDHKSPEGDFYVRPRPTENQKAFNMYRSVLAQEEEGQLSIPLEELEDSDPTLIGDPANYTNHSGGAVEEIKGLFEKLKNIIPENVILPQEYEVRQESTPPVTSSTAPQSNQERLTIEQEKIAKDNVIEQNFYDKKPYKKGKDSTGKDIWSVYRTKDGSESSMEGAIKGVRIETTRSVAQQEQLLRVAKSQGITSGVKGTIVYMEDRGEKSNTKGLSGWFRITSDFYTPNKKDFNNYENWSETVWEDRSSDFKIGKNDEWKSVRFEALSQSVESNVKESTEIDPETQAVPNPIVPNTKTIVYGGSDIHITLKDGKIIESSLERKVEESVDSFVARQQDLQDFYTDYNTPVGQGEENESGKGNFFEMIDDPKYNTPEFKAFLAQEQAVDNTSTEMQIFQKFKDCF